MFDCAILAGGTGSRLKSVTGEVPKPMVPVAGIPFLYRIMQALEAQQCRDIYLSLCYQADYIIDRVNADRPVHCNVHFCVEQEPLGTGGAIKNIAEHVKSHKFFVMNGDSLFDFNLHKIQKLASDYDLIINGVFQSDVGRYGALVYDDKMELITIKEKSGGGAGYINAGCYLVCRDDLLRYSHRSFSFETEFLPNYSKPAMVNLVDSFFYDIGVPDDYYAACKYFE